MLLKHFCVVFVILIMTSCASTQKNRDAQKELVQLTSQGKIDMAINLVKSDKFFPEERSLLVKKLELGTLHYLNKDYFQSLQVFDEAKELSDKLYTISLSKKITAAMSNPNEDNYYGEKFERSFLRFYLTLIHYEIYKTGKYEAYTRINRSKDGKETKSNIPEKILSESERRSHLFAARAMILEWDTLLSSYVIAGAGDSTYKTDLMAKLLGAFIHEQIGTRSDLNIARQLYKDAKDVLFKYYNLYPSYNSKYTIFAENYEKFPQMKKDVVQKEYVGVTPTAQALLNYIDQRITDLNSNNLENVKIILKEGRIARKYPKLVHFPLPVFYSGHISGKETDLFTFTVELLALSRGTKPSITYELPAVEKKSQDRDFFVVIKDDKNRNVLREKIIVIDPLSDIAWQTMENKISIMNAAIGARIAAKHVAAILAAYKIYKAQPNAFGKMAAGLAYAGANKAIAASELVDLRQWTTLPHNVRMASFKLKPGKQYQLFIDEVRGEKINQKKYQDFTVEKGKVISLDINILSH